MQSEEGQTEQRYRYIHRSPTAHHGFSERQTNIPYGMRTTSKAGGCFRRLGNVRVDPVQVDRGQCLA